MTVRFIVVAVFASLAVLVMVGAILFVLPRFTDDQESGSARLADRSSQREDPSPRPAGTRREGSVTGLAAGVRLVGWETISFASVSAGFAHSCGVKTDRSVACWGSDQDGQPSPPAGSFVSVSAGYAHNCGVKTDRSVACWGSDQDGQPSPRPVLSFPSAPVTITVAV